MVGTTVRKVILDSDGRLRSSSGKKGDAKRSQTAVTLNGKRNSMVDPANKGASKAFTAPCT